eukprot:7514932-Lingulodinium_polyedra.AAC.1
MGWSCHRLGILRCCLAAVVWARPRLGICRRSRTRAVAAARRWTPRCSAIDIIPVVIIAMT